MERDDVQPLHGNLRGVVLPDGSKIRYVRHAVGHHHRATTPRHGCQWCQWLLRRDGAEYLRLRLEQPTFGGRGTRLPTLDFCSRECLVEWFGAVNRAQAENPQYCTECGEVGPGDPCARADRTRFPGTRNAGRSR